MRSVRLDERLEARLAQAARMTGKPVSAVIRTAIDEHCDRVLGSSVADRWADVIGSVAGDGSGYSERTGEAFTELILERERQRKDRC